MSTSHLSNIKQRVVRRNEHKREISKSAADLTTTTSAELTSHREPLLPLEHDADFQDESSIKSRRPKRRRFRKKQRKSLIIEPDTGFILATGCSSTDDDDDENKTTNRRRSFAENIGDHSNERGRSKRKSADRKTKTSSTSNLIMDRLSRSTYEPNASRLGADSTRSLSVRDLNGDCVDFNNGESVSRWTSQMLAELDSLTDVSRQPEPRMSTSMFETTTAAATMPRAQNQLLERLFELREHRRDFTRRKSADPLSNHAPPPTCAPPPVPPPRAVDEEDVENEIESTCKSRSSSSSATITPSRNEHQTAKPNANMFISEYIRSIEEKRFAAVDKPEDVISSITSPSMEAGTQTASRSSSFDWINEPTETELRRELAPSRQHPSSDEADQEVARIADGRAKHKDILRQMDEGLALLLELGDANAFGKYRQSGAYDNMSWDRTKNTPGSMRARRADSSTRQRSSIARPTPAPTTTMEKLSAAVVELKSASEPRKPHEAPLKLAESDANEACSWLKQAGFPQYVEQFKAGKFPIDTKSVERDHNFLGTDALRALYRRIDTLNRCAIMKVDNVVMRRPRNQPTHQQQNENLYAGYDDDDDNVALSGNWQYQRQSQTWNRVREPNESIYGVGTTPHSRLVSTKPNWQMMSSGTMPERQVCRTDWYAAATPVSTPADAQKLQRTQSERIRERARAIIKKMDLRSTSRRRKHNEPTATATASVAPTVSDPVLLAYDRGRANRSKSAARRFPPEERRRDASMPPPVWTNEPTPFDAYLYPSTSLNRRLPRHTNLVVQDDGYYVHDVASDESISASSSLRVDTRPETDDDSMIMMLMNRRRDSGVGSSLSRSPSGPTSQRMRHSVLMGAKSDARAADETQFTDVELARSMDSLSCIEMSRLRKLAYLRITAMLEKTTDKDVLGDLDAATPKPAANWSMHRLMRRMKLNESGGGATSPSGVFGVGLDVIHRRSGQCLPRAILEILRFLRAHAADTVGLFRKNGVKSRIGELRAVVERHAAPRGDVFVGADTLGAGHVHDVADLLKQYLRELPEPLMTARLSETFASIFTHVPDVDRLTAVQHALVLMPDENREALQTLMLFLHDVAKCAQMNNMTAQNLAVCFTPSLFQLSASRLDKLSTGSRRHKTIGAAGMPTQKEMKETHACQQCLTMLIEYAKTVFLSPEEPRADDDIPPIKELGLKGARCFLVDRVLDMIRDHDDRWRQWSVESTCDGVEVSSMKPADSHPLKTFRVWIDVAASPRAVMTRIMKERHVWDESLLNWRHVEYVNAPDTDVHQYVLNETVGHATRDCHVARFHSSNLSEIRGACAIAERSVQCAESQLLGGITATIFDQRYLIEPMTGGQSRVTYLARVDLKGRTWQWYNKSYPSIMCRQMCRLRDSFRSAVIDGPETNL